MTSRPRARPAGAVDGRERERLPRPGERWTVIVPVKRLRGAKTRLRGALPDDRHRDLVLAMSLDTLSAALRCCAVRRVVVVTDDRAASAAAVGLGVDVVHDGPHAGLNPALAHAAMLVGSSRTWPGVGGVAAVTADLPALRPDELAQALRWAEDNARPRPGDPSEVARSSRTPVRSYVPDAAGTGTVLLAAPAGARLRPCFGAGSAPAHAASGAVALPGDWPGLRRDVDTATDLAEAIALGVGPHTAAVLAKPERPVRDDGGRLAQNEPMQGTVATFDEHLHHGSLLLDDGSAVDFSAQAFNASGLRLLRLGQRVRIDRAPTGEVTRITLPTLA